MMSAVGVISCAHGAWIESSITMGRALAAAIGGGAESRVHTPVDAAGLAACLGEAAYVILHTHGSPEGIYDQRADGRSTTVATLADIGRLPPLPHLRLVIATACQAAGGDPGQNLAAAISRKIAPEGLVIANRHVVFGADYDFGEREGRRGWVAYRAGRCVLTEQDLPARLTMADAYGIYLENRLK